MTIKRKRGNIYYVMANLVWGAVSVKYNILLDDDVIDAQFFDAMAKDAAETFDDFRARVAVNVTSWEIHLHGEKDARVYPTFEAFRQGIHALRVNALYCYDGTSIFSFIEWALREDTLHTWTRTSKDEQRDEDGRYNKVTGFKYAELSGDLGQRYSFDLWSVEKDKKKRDVTRGTHFYAFKNIFTKGLQNTFDAFGVSDVGRCECSAILDVLEKFNDICKIHFDAEYTGKKPLSLTCGGLARIALFAEMYGRETARKNENAFKKEHKLDDDETAYLRNCKLMRGGICCGNSAAWGRRLTPTDGVHLRKYDFNSEYSAIATEIPDLRNIVICDTNELYERDDEYVYIIVFSSFCMQVKRGMPCVFTHPWTGKNTQKIEIFCDFAIFAEELDELENFYNLGICDVKYVCKCKKYKNDGLKNFAEKWYKLKEEARLQGNGGFFAFTKFMNNAAWGQLAKKSKFPQILHEYNENTGLFELRKYNTENVENTCKYSLLVGALITARGRVKTMRAIRRICGDKNALDVFVYSDTDSVAAFAEAPADMLRPGVLGDMKEEIRAIDSKYLGKKIYYNIASVAPLKIDLHARGISKEAIVETLCENYGVDTLEELPAEAFAEAFDPKNAFTTPAIMQVHGGRVKLYVRKFISVDGIKVMQARGSKFFLDADGNINEL